MKGNRPMKRRREPVQSNAGHKAAVDAAIQEMNRASQGIWTLEVLFRDEALDLGIAIVLGEPWALLLSRRLSAAMARLETAAPMCLTCEATPATDDIGAVAICAGGEGAESAPFVANAICVGCVVRLRAKEAVLEAAKQKYLAGFDGIRELRISNHAGNA